MKQENLIDDIDDSIFDDIDDLDITLDDNETDIDISIDDTDIDIDETIEDVKDEDDDIIEDEETTDSILFGMTQDFSIEDELIDDIEDIDFEDDLLLDDLDNGKEEKSKPDKEIVDTKIFIANINKKLDNKALRHLKIVSTEANKLRKIDRSKIVEILSDTESTEAQRKKADYDISKLLEDIVPRLEYIEKLRTGVSSVLNTQFRMRPTGRPYRELTITNKEVAIFLNDFLRLNLIGDSYSNEIIVPPTFDEVKNEIIYKVFCRDSSPNIAYNKVIVLANFYRQRKNLAESDYKNMTFGGLFVDKIYDLFAVKEHYEMLRNELIEQKNKIEKEFKENELFLSTELEHFIPNEVSMIEENQELFYGIITNRKEIYTKIILDNFTYVRKLILGRNEKTFICGDCGKKSDIKIPFAKFFFFNTSQGYTYDEPVMGINRCEHCGKLNTLTGVELKEIRKLRDERMMEAKNIANILERLSSPLHGALIPGIDIYEAVLQERYSNVDDEDLEDLPSHYENKVEVIDASGNISPLAREYIEAIEEFRRSEMFYMEKAEKPLSVDVKEQLKRCSVEITIELPKSEQKATGQKTKSIMVQLASDSPSIERFIKVACNILYKNYTTEKRNAILSLINYLNASNLGDYFNASNIDTLKAISNSLDNLNYYCDVSKRTSVDTELAKEILLNRLAILNKYGDFTLEEMQEEFNKIDEKFIEQEKSKYKLTRDLILKEIYAHSNLYSCIPITNFETTNIQHIIPYISDSKIWEMILYISNLMIINNLAEDLIIKKVLPTSGDAQGRIRLLEQTSSASRTLQDALGSLYKSGNNKELERNLRCLSSAGKYLYIEDLLPLGALRDSIMYEDDFALYNAIYDLENIINLNIKEVAEIKDLVKHYYNDAKAFVEKYGSDNYSKWLYIYGLQFSEDEIDEDLINPSLKMHRDLIPKRVKGESFKDYIARQKKLTDDILETNTELFKPLSKYIILLNGLKAFSEFINTSVKNLEIYLAGAEMFRLALTYDEQVWLDILKLTHEIVNYTDNEIPDFDFNSYIDLKLPSEEDIFLAKAFYPNYILNKNVLLCDSDFMVIPEDDDNGIKLPMSLAQYQGYEVYKNENEMVYISPYMEDVMHKWKEKSK